MFSTRTPLEPEHLGDAGVAEGVAELGADETLVEPQDVVLLLRAPLLVAEHHDRHRDVHPIAGRKLVQADAKRTVAHQRHRGTLGLGELRTHDRPAVGHTVGAFAPNRAEVGAVALVAIHPSPENGTMADENHSEPNARGSADDALARLRAQVLARWNVFPDRLRGELDALFAEALERATAAAPEVLTVMDPASRPQRLRLATVAAEADLDSFYHNEWAELAISHLKFRVQNNAELHPHPHHSYSSRIVKASNCRLCTKN